MAKNYNKMAIDIVREIGGEENVKSLAHCMTRLRFIVKDEKKVNLEALKMAEELDVTLLPYELAGGMEVTREVIRQIKSGQSVGIFIGPEGGFEPEEVDAAVSMGAKVITLGRRILRTETAGLATLAVLMFELEQ